MRLQQRVCPSIRTASTAAMSATRRSRCECRVLQRRPPALFPYSSAAASLSSSPLPSPRRRLQTATAYRPYSLPPEPPTPPRNAGVVPETSITFPDPPAPPPPSTTTMPEPARASRPGDGMEDRPSSFTPPSPRASGRGTRDLAAENGLRQQQQQQQQKSSSGASTTEDSTTTSTPTILLKAQTRGKLRPRRAAMALTPAAVEQLRQLLRQPEPKLIRVGVRNRGCSGLAYHLEYVERPGMFDETVEQEGVKVLIDSKALFSIIGSEMDWQEDRLSSRFVFRNPNISMWLPCPAPAAAPSPTLPSSRHPSSLSLSPPSIPLPSFRLLANPVLSPLKFSEEQCGCGESFMV